MTTPEVELPVGSAAAGTPAGRLIELRQEIVYLQRELAEASAAMSKAEEKNSRFTNLGGVSFAGIPIAQSWVELVLWESLLNDRKFKAVIELGTWQGGFAWWMWAQTMARGMKFYTFDAVEPDHEMPHDTFARLDVFIHHEKISELINALEPVILFCDNGNKPREVRIFGPMLQDSRSLLVVHDWGTEMQPEDVPDDLEMVYKEYCEEIGSMNRVFKRRDA